MTVDTELSRRLQKAVRGEDQMCFKNSVLATFNFARGTKALRYVEGYAISELGIVVLHGWVEYRGKVVETTPVWLKQAGNTHYFPGRRYTRSELSVILGRKDETMLPLCGWGERLTHAHRAAWVHSVGEDGYALLFARRAA